MTCESTSHEESRHEALKRHTRERKKMADFLTDDQRAGNTLPTLQLMPWMFLAFVLIHFHALVLNRVML